MCLIVHHQRRNLDGARFFAFSWICLESYHTTHFDIKWIVNIRVSKMGGLIRSLEVLEAARNRGTHVVVGAQVGETSLLTRAALGVARQAGELLFAQEGAFGTLLLEKDVCQSPLMFGRGALLDPSSGVRDAEYLVAIDLVAGRRGHGAEAREYEETDDEVACRHAAHAHAKPQSAVRK